MAVDRAIRVYVDSGTDAEVTMTLIRRLLAHGEAAGSCVSTYGAVTAGTRVNNMLITVGSGGTNTVSVGFLIDSGVTADKYLELMGRVFDACRAAGTCVPVTGTYAVGAGSTDSLSMAIT